MGTSTFGRIPATAYSQTCLNAGRHDGNGLIRRSFSAETRPGVVSRRIMHPVAFGDRIYARLMSGGRTLMEFSTQSINDLSELWGLLRRQTSGLRGLVRLYIRNMSRGWSVDRPLMLYSPRAFSHRAPITERTAASAPAPAYPSAAYPSSAYPSSAYSSAARTQTIMPWHTH